MKDARIIVTLGALGISGILPETDTRMGIFKNTLPIRPPMSLHGVHSGHEPRNKITNESRYPAHRIFSSRNLVIESILFVRSFGSNLIHEVDLKIKSEGSTALIVRF